ncbi:MAG: fimbrial protein [Pseudomonadales bacterium]|nr:fimbrial protein [Pseudomonadales bacterium]MBH2077058.1 fimbrial protein [Pseudomonadales bacterium]
MNSKFAMMALLVGSAFASVANAADGTINFTGNITDQACTVDPASANKTVKLGSVRAGVFGAAGTTAAPTRFSIMLTSCPAGVTSASMKFDGPTSADNSNLVALTGGTGAAEGVAVGIYEVDSATLIPVGSASKTQTLVSGANNTFDFIAKYVSTAATVKTGVANATSNFTVTYN